MKPEILTKLAQALAQPVASEGKVVYIIVEPRKLIEINGDGARFRIRHFPQIGDAVTAMEETGVPPALFEEFGVFILDQLLDG